MTVLAVAGAAAVASVLRFVAGHYLDGRLPWGTITVNVVGSFLLGVVTGSRLPEDAAVALGTGFCGGLTTYSAFVVQSHQHGLVRGTLTVVATLPTALLACALGFRLAGG